MLRLLFTLFLIIVASVLYSYVHDLNPGSINIWLSPSATFELSPVSLMLVSMAIGALIVILFVGVRETRDLILTWRSDRLRRREEKVESSIGKARTPPSLNEQPKPSACFTRH